MHRTVFEISASRFAALDLLLQLALCSNGVLALRDGMAKSEHKHTQQQQRADTQKT
jgi:hypothetical protein